MKITAVMGSPTKDGNTCVLAREVLRGAADAGAAVDEIFLAEHRIEFCRGCISRKTKTNCMVSGACVIPDDVNALRRRLYESDGIVLASPSYGIKPTARMKNFIVDRIGMYTAYTSGLGGKYFVGVSTCGGIGAERVARELAKAYRLGQRLVEDIQVGRQYPFQKLFDRVMTPSSSGVSSCATFTRTGRG